MSLLAAAAVLSAVLQAPPAHDFVTESDVVFADRGGDTLALDLVRPSGDGPFPLMLCLHGGGWRQGDRREMRAIVVDWARAGFAAATSSYRLVPQATWPAQLDDALAALAFLRTHAARFHLDKERIGATGFSAGGQLALLLGFDAARTEAAGGPVRAVVSYFAPTDLRGLDRARGFAGQLVRAVAAGAPLADLSPVTFVDAGDAPILTLHGTDDPVVPAAQAETLHERLRAAHVPNRLELLEGAGHGWGGRQLARTQALARGFAARYLRGGDLPLLVAEDFDAGMEAFETWPAAAFEVRAEPRRCLALTRKSDYAPPVRSPTALAVLRAPPVADFVLDVDLRSTTREYPHRDLCIVFAWQSPTRFYYVHLASEPDDRAHGVFLVDGRDRVNVTTRRDGGMRWGDGWHRVRVQRSAANGVAVFAGDFVTPVMTATDTTLGAGRVGVGSFDDQGEFDALRLYGQAAPGDVGR